MTVLTPTYHLYTYIFVLGLRELTVMVFVIDNDHPAVPQTVSGWRMSAGDLHAFHVLRNCGAHVDGLFWGKE